MKRIISLLLCAAILAAVPVIHAYAASVLQQVEVTIDEPAVGNAPQFNCKVKTEGCAVYKFDPVMWIDKTEDRYLERGDYFQEGHHYAVQIWVAAKTGYKFGVDAYDNIQTTGKINQHTATVYKAYEQAPEEVLELYYDFGVLVSIHTCTPWPVARVEPTCTESGHERYWYCQCGMCYSDPRGEEPVDINSWGIIPALGHTPSGWRITQVYHYMVCTACGELLGEEDHAGGTATCEEQAQCTVCGSFYGELDSEHRWGSRYDYSDAYGHAWVCADCGGHDTLIAHNPGPVATEKDPQICKDCGYIISPAINHIHKLKKIAQTPATCTRTGNIEYYICGGCSERFADAAGQNAIPGSMSVEVGALGHTASDAMECDGGFHWRTCTQCGEMLIETKMRHEIEDGICTTCGYSLPRDQKQKQEQTTPPETAAPEQPAPEEEGNVPISMLTVALLGGVSFAVAITATVIILKRKK